MYIFLLKCCRRKKDQNRNMVFISGERPGPSFLRSVMFHNWLENYQETYFGKYGEAYSLQNRTTPIHTFQTFGMIFMVHMPHESIILQKFMWRMVEVRKCMWCTSIAAESCWYLTFCRAGSKQMDSSYLNMEEKCKLFPHSERFYQQYLSKVSRVWTSLATHDLAMCRGLQQMSDIMFCV